jgi:hypothetical protein
MKQETLEKAALNIIPDESTAGWIDSFSAWERQGFIKGAKWQADNVDTMQTRSRNTNPDNNTVNIPALRKTITTYLDNIGSHGMRSELTKAVDVLYDFMLYVNEIESEEIFEISNNTSTNNTSTDNDDTTTWAGTDYGDDERDEAEWGDFIVK